MPQRVLSEEEYNAVREQVLASAPPNLDEATFNKWIGPTMTAAIAEAELRAPEQQGSAIGRFASNAASMLNPIEMAKGAYQAVRHPIDTGTAIVGAMGDQWSQGIDLAKQGRLIEGAGHMAAGSLPVIGPTAANIGEQIGQGDVAGGMGATAGLLAPFGVKPAVQTARTMTPKGLRATIAESLEARAGKRYASTMAPQVGPNKTRFGNQAEQVGPELAKNPNMGAWSREGLHAKVDQAFEAAGVKLDEAANSRLNARTFDTQPIIDNLRQVRQRWVSEAVEGSEFPRQSTTRPSAILDETGQPAQVTEFQRKPIGRDVVPEDNAARVAKIDEAIRELEQLGPQARYESIRRIREAFDKPAKIKYAPSVTQDFLKKSGESSGAADVTGTLRSHLAKFDPETAIANEGYSLYKTAKDVLDATAEVERTRPRVGRAIMTRLTTTMAGGQQGGVAGAAAGYVLGPIVDAAAASAPTIRLQTAQLMTRLAKAIRAGDVEQVNSITSRLQRLVPAGSVSVAQQTAPVSAERQRHRPAETAGR